MEEVEQQQKTKKKNNTKKYLIYISFVLIATGISLFLSLHDKFNQTIEALASCDWRYLLLIMAVVLFYISINAFIIFIFCRLYTNKYHYHQAMASVMIYTFYADVTPGSSGGQPMQAYTISKQGVDVSNAASILVMWYIVYQVVLVLFGSVGLVFKWGLLSSMESLNFRVGNTDFSIPIIPAVLIGFGLNLIVILFLFLMSYSHKLHNFILNHGVNIGAKLRLVKNPDKTRQNLRVKVENFRIELRRLQSNLPLTIFISILFFIMICAKFSLPWFAGIALNGYGDIYKTTIDGTWIKVGHTVGDYSIVSFFDACFLSSFHQMVTGLIPIPGSAGVSEIFFSMVFNGFYAKKEHIAAAQIIWRTASYHIPLLAGGIVSAFYHVNPTEHFDKATSQTFTNLQIETYEARKESSDKMYQTAKLNAEEIRKKLHINNPFGKKKNVEEIVVEDKNEITNNDITVTKKEKPKKEKKPFDKRKEKEDEDSDYGSITIDS